MGCQVTMSGTFRMSAPLLSSPPLSCPVPLPPTRSAFFAAPIKDRGGKTSLCWSCGSMSRGLGTGARMEGGTDLERKREGEGGSD